MAYTFEELLLYLFVYAFLGWTVQGIFHAVKDRKFVNRGFLNLPMSLPCGITSVLTILALPTLDGHGVLQYLATWTIMGIVYRLVQQFVKRISRRSGMSEEAVPDLSQGERMIAGFTAAGAYLIQYLVIHPFVYTLITLMHEWAVRAVVWTITALVLLDYFSVRYALRTKRIPENAERRKERTQKIADRMTDRIWDRLERAYPGLSRTANEDDSGLVFARGICFDKLAWVFLASSFLGALIEMVYCRAMGDIWMNRSSVLYGAFSFVWGFGAVVLTVVLQRVAGKGDGKVFLAGFAVGGAYEYLCSVFTELVFGTVFWDYSQMPLNIGGRTNVLYCIFWGILAVVWIKILYPKMENVIEKIPPLAGKILTWILVLLMTCNGLLTVCAMQRYTERQTEPEPSNFIEVFVDSRYDDDWMEHRWPNMKITVETGN